MGVRPEKRIRYFVTSFVIEFTKGLK